MGRWGREGECKGQGADGMAEAETVPREEARREALAIGVHLRKRGVKRL
jgi:hypothetical protein